MNQISWSLRGSRVADVRSVKQEKLEKLIYLSENPFVQFFLRIQTRLYSRIISHHLRVGDDANCQARYSLLHGVSGECRERQQRELVLLCIRARSQ